MKRIIAILAILFSTILFSQKCKYKRNEVDEFTGNKVIITKEKMLTKSGLGFGTSATFHVERVGNIKVLSLKVISPRIFTLEEGDNVMLKTKKEGIIKLYFSKTVIANYVNIPQIRITRWIANDDLILDDQAIKKLSNSEIVKVRWYTTDGYVEKEVKKRNAGNISKALKCIKHS